MIFFFFFENQMIDGYGKTDTTSCHPCQITQMTGCM